MEDIYLYSFLGLIHICVHDDSDDDGKGGEKREAAAIKSDIFEMRICEELWNADKRKKNKLVDSPTHVFLSLS